MYEQFYVMFLCHTNKFDRIVIDVYQRTHVKVRVCHGMLQDVRVDMFCGGVGS